MKVFLSWSGDLSKKVAAALDEWLPQVIQSVEPFFSAEDIDKGTRWSQVLSAELSATSIGVFCVTRQNLASRWLNFEAGAISKAIGGSRVMPFLFGLKKSEVQWPLAEFQMTIYEKDDIRRLINSINRSCTPQCVDDTRLVKSFERWWPDLEGSLRALLKQAEEMTAAVPEQQLVKDREILEELLELARQHQRLLTSIVNGDIDDLLAIPKPRLRNIELQIQGALDVLIGVDGLTASDPDECEGTVNEFQNAVGEAIQRLNAASTLLETARRRNVITIPVIGQITA